MNRKERSYSLLYLTDRYHAAPQDQEPFSISTVSLAIHYYPSIQVRGGRATLSRPLLHTLQFNSYGFAASTSRGWYQTLFVWTVDSGPRSRAMPD